MESQIHIKRITCHVHCQDVFQALVAHNENNLLNMFNFGKALLRLINSYIIKVLRIL